jgi:hypothetical protein
MGVANGMSDAAGDGPVIYRAMFAREIPSRTLAAYCEAVGRLPLLPNPVAGMRLAVSPRRLADAEFALRLLRGRNGLTQRFHVMFYLAEIEPGVQRMFSRSARSRACGLLDGALAAVAAAPSLLCGWWAIRRVPRA